MSARFVGKLVLFALPVAALLSLPVVLAVHMGEALPPQAVVRAQLGETPILYGPSDRETIFAYKLRAAQTRRPEVLVVGSSRALQLRAQLLNRNPGAFYNAGGEAWGLREVTALVENLDPQTGPRVLLLGLDQTWFNADFVDWETPANLDLAPINIGRTFGGARALIDNLLAENLDLQSTLDRDVWVRDQPQVGLGLHALRFGSGYRNDGSYQDGNILVNPALAELARSHDLEAAPTGWRQFVHGSAVSEPALARLDALLRLAKARGMIVIGYGPPFTPSIHAVLMAGGQNRYIPLAARRLEALFAAHGFRYFDYASAAWVGGTDEELYDGWHATELLALRIYLDMLRALPEVLGRYSDVDYLEGVAAQASNPIDVFGL